MEKIRIEDANTSKREKDANGFLIIRDNPIAKAGVFDYLLSEVFSQVEKGKDRIVRVCREFENLKANKDLFAGKPIKWEHYWVGKEGETQTGDGAIFGEVRADEPYLKADLIIYNKDLIAKIEAGEVVELSPAYEANIEAIEGSYNGESYAYLQKLKEVNHLAVVEVGRSGSDLRIYDTLKEEIIKMKKKVKLKDNGFIKKLIARLKDEDTTQEDSSTEVIEKIVAIAGGEGSDDEKLLSIIETLKDFHNESEEVEAKEEEDACKDSEEAEVKEKDGEGEVEAKKEGGEISLTAEELTELIEKVTDSKIKKLQDSMHEDSKRVAQAYKEVSSALGTSFDFTNKNANDIYKFGYEMLSKQKLQDSMDAKTAFIAVSNVNSVSKSSNVKTNDKKVSDSNDKIGNLLKLYK